MFCTLINLPTCGVDERRDEYDSQQNEEDGDKFPRAPSAQILFDPPMLAVLTRGIWRRTTTEALVAGGARCRHTRRTRVISNGGAVHPTAGRGAPNQPGSRGRVPAGRRVAGQGRVVKLPVVAVRVCGGGRAARRSSPTASSEHLAVGCRHVVAGGRGGRGGCRHVVAGCRHGEVVVGAVRVVGGGTKPGVQSRLVKRI
jgi:hypothetical protein